jgi:hypothetical protein
VKITFHILSVLALAAWLSACKKDKDVLGVDVQPADDALNASFSSTAPVYAYTLKYDSVSSLNSRYKYLGINRDPYFGTTDVGLYLMPNIPDGKTFVSFGDDAELSSAEIILAAYNLGVSHVGNTNAQVTYSVYPIAVRPDSSKVYFTSYDKFHNTDAVLGAYTGSYTTIDGKPVLRIPVDHNFAKAILNNPQYLVDNGVFQNTYKGFYIKSSLNADDGLITQVDLQDALSGFYLYYTNGSPPAVKTPKSFRFTFGGTNPVRYNTMVHNPVGGHNLFVQQWANNDTAKGGDALFLKGMGVSKVRVHIPTLKTYSDSFTVAVNRAELVFRLHPSFSTGVDYEPPGKLLLLAADSTGKEVFVQDQVNAVDGARYNGAYDADTKSYVFNIARHAQAVLSGKKKNYGFYLVVANTENVPTYSPSYIGSTKELRYVGRDNYVERVVLAGSNQLDLKPVFNLSYIKFKND